MHQVMVLQTSSGETKPVTMLRLPDQETAPQDMASENAHPGALAAQPSQRLGHSVDET